MNSLTRLSTSAASADSLSPMAATDGTGRPDGPGRRGPSAGTGRPDGPDGIGRRFLLLADTEFAGYSPLYERLARHVAARPNLLQALHGRAPENQAPVRFLAAVHDHLLRHPEEALAAVYRGEADDPPEPLLDALLVDHLDGLGSREYPGLHAPDPSSAARPVRATSIVPRYSLRVYFPGIERFELLNLSNPVVSVISGKA